MTPKEKRNERLAAKLITNLERRHFEAYYCHTASDIIAKVKEIIPEGSSISWGGSMSIRDTGLTQALKSGPYKVFDHIGDVFWTEILPRLKALESQTWSEILVRDKKQNHSLDLDDLNKVAQDVNAALQRARSIASPINAARFDIDTPCQNDGMCHNCKSPQSICNYVHFLRNSHPAKRHIVILTDLELGY